LLFAAALHAGEADDTELAYLRAWYTLEVEEQPKEAEEQFQKLIAGEKLSPERHALCMIGIARCRIAAGNKAEGREMYRKIRRLVKGFPSLEKKVGAALEKLGPGPHTGEFKFHYKQGFDFKTGKVADGADADVVFANCAGGISSITLVAPGGIMGLGKTLGRRETGLQPRAIFDAVAAAFPARLRLGGSAKADRRSPESDVFIVRTRDGGWAKLAIVHRGKERGWQKHLAHVVYSYNPDKPLFATLPADAGDTAGPIVFSREMRATEEEIAAEERERQRAVERSNKQAKGGGKIPEIKNTQEVLLARSKFSDYEKATFSFRFGIRDDPGRAQTRNDWDLQFGNGPDNLDVCMVTDDESTIVDLGENTWATLSKRKELAEGADSNAKAIYGHAYLIHTIDRDTDYLTLIRVAAHTPGVACHIEWVSLQAGELKTSPGLELTIEENRHILWHLQTIERRAKRKAEAAEEAAAKAK
jgi:hypothetical protein